MTDFTNNPQNEIPIRLAADIRLRREYFGALVYDTRNGNILEVDKETFHFLDLIKDKPLRIDDAISFLVQNKIIRNSHRSIDATLRKLFELNIIEKRYESLSVPVLKDQRSVKHNKPWLSAPETVHWAVTYRCEENCPDCYTRRFPGTKAELSTPEALQLIDTIADWGVFQLAIGGGEPFTRQDLPRLVHHADKRGLSVHITTGKLELEPRMLESVSGSLRNLQIGLRPHDLLGPDSEDTTLRIKTLFRTIQTVGIMPGANIVLTKTTVEQIAAIIKMLDQIGFRRIILLRYKPPASIERWRTEKPEAYQMKRLHEIIGETIRHNPHLHIRMDCSLSFIQRHLPSELAAAVGFKGCVAGDRILALTPDGSAYPCSQLVSPRCYAGNLLEMKPQLIWDQSRNMRKYRFFRARKPFANSWCGVCLVKNTCGGCRVFSPDALGGDNDCPEPVLPRLTQLGKRGRSLDLIQYLKYHGAISVAEYMARYGVGQRTAIKELNASPHAKTLAGKSAPKKKTVYFSTQEDLIWDIQDSIGYTSSGFPLATYDQIAEWIETPFDVKGYPQWIKDHTPDHRDILIKLDKKDKNKRERRRKR